MKTKLHSWVVTFSLLLISASCASVEEKVETPPSLVGTWINKNDNFQVEIKFKEDHTASFTIFDLSENNHEQIHTIGTWNIKNNMLTTNYTEKHKRIKTNQYTISTEINDVDISSSVPFVLGERVLRLNWKGKSLFFTKDWKPTKNDFNTEIDNILLTYSDQYFILKRKALPN